MYKVNNKWTRRCRCLAFIFYANMEHFCSSVGLCVWAFLWGSGWSGVGGTDYMQSGICKRANVMLLSCTYEFGFITESHTNPQLNQTCRKVRNLKKKWSTKCTHTPYEAFVLQRKSCSRCCPVSKWHVAHWFKVK